MTIQMLFEKFTGFLNSNIAYLPYVAIGFFVLLFVLNPPWKWMQKLNEYDKLVEQLMQTGVIAPAVVVSAKSNGTLKVAGRSKRRKITYVADVQPQDGKPAFRAEFTAWLPDRNYNSILFNVVMGEAGRKIWVAYNPNDSTQMVFGHYDEDHEQALAHRRYAKKRNDFIDMEKEAIRVRETGEEALAVILELEELGIETEQEKREGISLWVKVKITPENRPAFESETCAMVSLDTVSKVAVGRQFHIKFDPNKPEICALIRAMG